MNLFTPKINKKGQSFKHGQKVLDLHTIFDTLQALEQITDPGNLKPLELIYHVNINSHRLQPSRARRAPWGLRTPNPAPVRGSAGFYGLRCHYWSVNMQTTMKYETGAESRGANNLVLSVMNDGAVYKDRMHVITAMLQGSTHGSHTIITIVHNEARNQRLNGSKFPARDISEAVRLIAEQSIEHWKEIIVSDWNGEPITIEGRKWWDKVNGNTYFSCRVSIPSNCGVRWFSVPSQYGYGDHWKHEAVDVLRRVGFDIIEYRHMGNPTKLIFDDRGYGLKRHMFEGKYL